MALENYRVIQYPEKTEIDNSDFALIDSEGNGTHKYQLSRIPAEAEAKAQAAVAAEAAAREAADNELKADLNQAIEDFAVPTQEAVDNWLDAHPEATTTVNDGAITSAKLSSALKSSPFYDVTRYGIFPDTGIDLYDSLYDFLHDVVVATGGIVYFPQGTYIISDSIFIPPNTIFMGSGAATKIKFTEEYPSFGVALSNGGSNIGIINMTVDCNRTDRIPAGTGNFTGSIGFGTRTFETWTEKHKSPSGHASCENLVAEDLWTNTWYILQTETQAREDPCYVRGVVYRNIHAQNSMVSIMSRDAISDIDVQNVECAFLRIGTSTAPNATRVRVSNVRTGRVFLYCKDVSVDRLTLLPELKYDTVSYSGAVTMYGKIQITNSYIDASNYLYGFTRLASQLRFINVICVNSLNQVLNNSIGASDPNFDKVVMIGCHFETSGSTNSVIYGRMVSTYFPTLATSSKVQEYVSFRQRIGENDDLNNYRSFGRYFCSGASTKTLANIPATMSQGFYLDVDTHDMIDEPTTVVQKITSLYGNLIFVRTNVADTWDNWYKYQGTALT